MHQNKREAFVAEYRPEGRGVVEVAGATEIEVLLCGDQQRPEIEPLVGLVVRMPWSVWEEIENGAEHPRVHIEVPTPISLRVDEDVGVVDIDGITF